MTNKINMAELLADREKGTDGPWTNDDACGGVLGPLPLLPSIGLKDVDRNRIARLPDLEAAFIEAVKALRLIAENSDPELRDPFTIARTTLEKIRG